MGKSNVREFGARLLRACAGVRPTRRPHATGPAAPDHGVLGSRVPMRPGTAAGPSPDSLARERGRSRRSIVMETLAGFPNLPAMISVGQSPTSFTRMRRLGGDPARPRAKLASPKGFKRRASSTPLQTTGQFTRSTVVQQRVDPSGLAWPSRERAPNQGAVMAAMSSTQKSQSTGSESLVGIMN